MVGIGTVSYLIFCHRFLPRSNLPASGLYFFNNTVPKLATTFSFKEQACFVVCMTESYHIDLEPQK